MTEDSSVSINIGAALAVFDNTAIGVARTPVEIVRRGRDAAFSDWNNQDNAAWIQQSGTGLTVSFEIDVPASSTPPVLDSNGALAAPATGGASAATGRELQLLPLNAAAGRGLRFPSAIMQTAWRYTWTPSAPHRLKLGFSAFPDAEHLVMAATDATAAGLLPAPRTVTWDEIEENLADELNSAVPFGQDGMWYSGSRSAARNGGAVRVMSEIPDVCGTSGAVVLVLAIRRKDSREAANVAARLLAALPWYNRAGFTFVAVEQAVRTENGGINVTLAATFSR